MCVWDKAVAPRALRVFVDGRGRCQVAPYEGVQAALDREPLSAAAQWQPGQFVAVGRSLLGLARYRPPDAALHPSADGAGIDFNRPPRLLPPGRDSRFQLPAPPPAAERRPLPILMAAVPLVMGVAMAYFLHQVYLLAIGGPEPGHADRQPAAASAGTAARPPPAGRRRTASTRRASSATPGEALDAERADGPRQFPDPAAVLSIASGPAAPAVGTPPHRPRLPACCGSGRPTCRQPSS